MKINKKYKALNQPAKVLTFCLFFFISSNNSFAQIGQIEFGLNFSPSISRTNRYNEIPSRTANFSIGLFYNYQLFPKVELGSAFKYQQLYLKQRNDKVNMFKLYLFPVNFNINLTKIKNKSNLFCVIGYSFGKILNYNQAVNDYGLKGLVRDVHFFGLGLELRKVIKDKYRISIGPQFKITNIYSLRYGNILIYEMVVKYGKIWR